MPARNTLAPLVILALALHALGQSAEVGPYDPAETVESGILPDLPPQPETAATDPSEFGAFSPCAWQCALEEGDFPYLEVLSAETLAIAWLGPDTDGDCLYGMCDPCPDQALGDANCDGAVDFADIQPFILALTQPALWQARSGCERTCVADMNMDGVVDTGDIDTFTAVLVGHCPACLGD
jgi:hypothetical protein